MKQALILGCSHAAGTEIFPDPVDTKNHSYPAIIAQHLGYTVNNQGIAGGSNDAMFRIFEEQRLTLNENDIVIACWSGYTRTEIWNDATNRWQAIAPGKSDVYPEEYLKYQEQWIVYHTDYRIGRLNKIKNILALNCLANQQNIKVINIDSFWPVTDMVWPDDIYWPVTDNFYNWCSEQNYPHTDWGHYFESAHEEFAKFVVKHLPR